MVEEIQFSAGFERALLQEALGEVRRLANPFVTVCESPIEIAFVSAFRLFCKLLGHVTVLGDAASEPATQAAPFRIYPQHGIDRYRVDFLIVYGDRNIVVECDGRDYHHSTRQQIDRDRERDVILAELGFQVVRFPGRQIDAEPFHCAADVALWLLTGKFLSA